MGAIEDGQAAATTNATADAKDDNNTGSVAETPVLANVEIVTATNVILANESGKTFFLSAAAGFESTLPAPAAGLRYRFFVKTAPTSVGYTITAGTADTISGTVAASGAETIVNGITAALADNVILVANQALVGDYLDFVSDGALWYVTGNVNTFAALTANG